MNSYRIDKMKLINAISHELNRQFPNIPADHRFNIIIQAADMIIDAYQAEPVIAEHGMGLNAWLASDDTGPSSLSMASILSGGQFNAENHYPRDPDDLGRCIRLIRAVPEFKDRIHLLRDHGKQWSAVANNWEHWTVLYDVDDEELYTSMENAYSREKMHD